MRIRKYIGLMLLLLLFCGTATGEDSGRAFENFNASNGLADNSAQTIHCTKTGRLVITTMGQINFFDGQKFSYIDPTEENLFPLSNYLGNYHLYFDRYHHIWLKDRQSVTCVNLTTEKFVPSIEAIFREFGMESKVTDLFVSSDGIVWLLTDEGIWSVDTKQYYKVRKGQNLQDLEVKDDRLLLFYADGVADMVDLKTGRMLKELPAYDSGDRKRYDGSSVLCVDSTTIYQLRNGVKESVLLGLDTEKWEWSTLMKMPYHLNNVTKQDSLLYVPSEYGYWVYNVSDGKSVHIDRLLLANGQELETDVNVMA